jgi:hypothetical protein
MPLMFTVSPGFTLVGDTVTETDGRGGGVGGGVIPGLYASATLLAQSGAAGAVVGAGGCGVGVGAAGAGGCG